VNTAFTSVQVHGSEGIPYWHLVAFETALPVPLVLKVAAQLDAREVEHAMIQFVFGEAALFSSEGFAISNFLHLPQMVGVRSVVCSRVLVRLAICDRLPLSFPGILAIYRSTSEVTFNGSMRQKGHCITNSFLPLSMCWKLRVASTSSLKVVA
jgi:hypothetical protein